jgi:mannan endo-1,4-beta-mannosidase
MAKSVIAMNIRVYLLMALVLLLWNSCHSKHRKAEPEPVDTIPFVPPKEKPVDTLLTSETGALWINLKRLQGKGIIFGQQDATISGVDWKGLQDKSDIREITGTYPALYGWELAGAGDNANIDSVPFASIRQGMIEVFDRGGINTATWHLNNPVTKGTAWDVFPAVQQILPDSSSEDLYKSELKNIAAFLHQLRTSDGKLVPVIFRPFHENNGNWFWWGKGHCTPEEYIRLWRFTVGYLRDTLQVHNLLYVYSTDMFETQQQYLERYPGDEWVDILGTENYWDFQTGATVSNGIAQLRILVDLANKRKKLAALTECGFEGIPVKNWWTQFLLKPLKEDTIARNISYLMVWRNANRKHYYAPFPGHKSAPDFLAFEKDTFTIFERDLKEIYFLKGQTLGK